MSKTTSFCDRRKYLLTNVSYCLRLSANGLQLLWHVTKLVASTLLTGTPCRSIERTWFGDMFELHQASFGEYCLRLVHKYI